MRPRQFADPLLIRDGEAISLQRIDFTDARHDEDWLQQLLMHHPQLIPTDEIEPAFNGSIAIAREVSTEAGEIDLLYANSDGLLTLIETKLWRNPQAQREVVAQVVDYAAKLAKWNYPQLVEAIREATGIKEGDPLVDAVARTDRNFDRPRFKQAVSRNLERGRFLLLIAGDGVRENVETMADFLQQAPHLGFTIALVEMALFQLGKGSDASLFVQPRIVARTREVVRAVVEVRGDRVEVTAPAEPAANAARTSITQERFLEQLAELNQRGVIEFAQSVIEEAPRHDLTVKWRKSGPSLQYCDADSGLNFSFGYLTRHGEAGFGWIVGQCEEAGIPREIGFSYLSTVAALITGASVNAERDAIWYNNKNADPPMRLLAPNKAAWFAAIAYAVKQIREAIRKK